MLSKEYQEHDGAKDGSTLASYEYLGAGTVVEIDYEEPDVRLDLIGSGNNYSGFDRFMRIVDQKWYDYGASADRDRYTYGYDRASNRTYRENTTTSSKDEFYTYDGMHRLTNFDRGNLNGGKTAISGTPVDEQTWLLDPTGNWTDFIEKASGTTTLDQDRSHNDVNEITAITASTGTDWVDPVYDRNGNMTTMPRPSQLNVSYSAEYDAWNRLVEIDGAGINAYTYEYDGLNRRISKDVDSTVRHFYYSASWQVLEERIDSSSNAESQNILGLRYVDELILRDRDTDANGSLDERLYYVQDANFNVTTLTDDAGDAVERYNYMPYGEMDVHTGAWGSRGASSYDNRIKFQGREFDVETGLFQFQNRCLHVELGRFCHRDPIAYLGSWYNLYQFLGSRPNFFVDPRGLQFVIPPSKPVVIPEGGQRHPVRPPRPVSRKKPTPNGSACRIAVHCVHGIGTPSSGTHCGIWMEYNGQELTLDARPWRWGTGFWNNWFDIGRNDALVDEESPGYEVSVPSSYPINVCACLLNYVRVFNRKKYLYRARRGNSNWALKCMMDTCRVSIDWNRVFGGKPTLMDKPPCAEYREGCVYMPGGLVPTTTCVKDESCPKPKVLFGVGSQGELIDMSQGMNGVIGHSSFIPTVVNGPWTSCIRYL